MLGLEPGDAAVVVVGFDDGGDEDPQAALAPDALVKEMGTYEYKDKTSGDEVTFLDKVKPNQSDHAIDALRYAVRLISSWRSSQQPLYVPYRIEA